jgi:CheY-like chemotaxis protein
LPAEGEKTRLLLMEDDAVNRMTLGMYLKKLGYRVDAAENGREGLEKLKAEAYEVVLMDIQMPVMDGMEAARRIRAGLRGATPPDVPIVAITAHAMQGDREKFLEAGMDEYVAKPLDLRELAGVLGRLLEERRSAA